MNLYELPVHPLATVIPMSSEEAIQTLADRMKEHGQRVPVKIAEIDGVMTLIDGRHRLAAAELIDLELEYEVIDGSVEFINEYIYDFLFMNKRPDISQQAMWEAIANPEGKQGERNDTTSGLKARSESSNRTLKRARFILKHSSFLTGEVLNGILKITPAYDIAKAEKATHDILKERTKVLQDESPEHAERVANGENIEKVFDEYVKGKELAINKRQAVLGMYRKMTDAGLAYAHPESRKKLIDAINSKECSEKIAKNFVKDIKKIYKGLAQLIEETQ